MVTDGCDVPLCIHVGEEACDENPTTPAAEITFSEVIIEDAYGYTGHSPALIIDASMHVRPKVCIENLRYTCEFVSGPRTDICEITEDQTMTHFDNREGIFTLATKNPAAIPPGIYVLDITGMIGPVSNTLSHRTRYHIEILDPCKNTDLVLLESPFEDQTYALRSTPVP